METTTNTKPRLAFAGVGWIGRNRMEVVAKSGLADIACVADPSPDSIAESLKISNGKIYSSFDEMTEDKDVDAIVIATPSALHMHQAVIALKNDKAVFCQKPLGRNTGEVRAVINAAYEADKLLGADFSYRYTTEFRKVLEVIRSGEIGEIFAVELKFHNAYGPDKKWFYDINQSGGGCLLDLGVHMIDLALLTLNFPVITNVDGSLYAKGIKIKGRSEVEDYADVKMQLENGASIHLSCSWNLNAGTDAIIEATFYGTLGGTAFRNANGSFYRFEAVRYRGTTTELIAGGDDNWGGRAILDWLQRLTIANKFSTDANSYLHSAEVIDRIYEQ